LKGLIINNWLFLFLGAQGPPGPAGPGLQRTGFMVVRHSQSAQVPDCPSGMVKLWDGYSLLMMQGNDHGYHQDLGKFSIHCFSYLIQFSISGSAGSCLQKFSALPYLRCDHTNVCYYGQTNDLTYYLSTTEPMPMMPVQRDQIRPYISRCAVCEAPANVMSFHSLSMTPPPCPNGWNILWQGYSFVMVG
jgi:collagen type IV alpha